MRDASSGVNCSSSNFILNAPIVLLLILSLNVIRINYFGKIKYIHVFTLCIIDVVALLLLRNRTVNTCPLLLPPLRVAVAVLVAVIALLLIRLLILLDEKCLVGRAEELRRDNIDYVVVLVLPLLLLHVLPIVIMVLLLTHRSEERRE